MEIIIAVIVGILVGGATCWLVQESRAKSRLTRLDADHRETAAALRG